MCAANKLGSAKLLMPQVGQISLGGAVAVEVAAATTAAAARATESVALAFPAEAAVAAVTSGTSTAASSVCLVKCFLRLAF